MATKAGEIQISAIVSRTTKDMLEEMVRARGLKKGHLVEEALRHHLQALQELPEDAIIPSKVVLAPDALRKVVREIHSPGAPPPALRKLMSRRRGN